MANVQLKRFLFLVAFLGCSVLASAKVDTTFLSVKDFGARGDGGTDDQPALLQCLKTAANHPGVVVVKVPYGTYLIQETLKVVIGKCDSLIIRGYGQGVRLPLIKTDKFITALDISCPLSAPKGKVSITGLAFKGNNPPYSPSHPYFDKGAFTVGIRIMNMTTAYISHNQVSDFYGEGIYLGYSDAGTAAPRHRFDHVVVSDNDVSNCWGLHATKSASGAHDDYGDGVYLSNVSSGEIYNNKIINNLQQTKQVGRAGLVLEYNVEDCLVKGNYISGYDRDIHLEADVGGHTIENNILEGSDFGILVFDNPAFRSKPIAIIGNKISNKGFPLKNDYTLIRNSQERCLISFYAAGNCRKGSKIINNDFEIDPGFTYKYSYIARFIASGLTVKGNTFSSHLAAGVRKTVFFNAPMDSIVANIFQNVDLHFATKYQKGTVEGNKLVGRVTTNLKM